HDVTRSRTLLDFEGSASFLAIGAAVENMALAAREMGLELECDPFPDPKQLELVARLRPRRTSEPSDPLVHQIAERATNRRLGARVALDAADRRALELQAGEARLQLVESPALLDDLGELLGRGDRVRLLSPTLHHEMMSELRWTSAEARRTRDG